MFYISNDDPYVATILPKDSDWLWLVTSQPSASSSSCWTVHPHLRSLLSSCWLGLDEWLLLFGLFSHDPAFAWQSRGSETGGPQLWGVVSGERSREDIWSVWHLLAPNVFWKTLSETEYDSFSFFCTVRLLLMDVDFIYISTSVGENCSKEECKYFCADRKI